MEMIEQGQSAAVDQPQIILPNGRTGDDGCSVEQNEMLEALSQMKDIRVKNQQKTESDLSSQEKFDSLKEIFVHSPLQFVTRFGKFLGRNQIKCIKTLPDENVQIYLKQLEKDVNDLRGARFRNRRYAALQKLVDTTDYFTEEEMQRRNPILYDQLIGKFQSKEEKEEFLKRSCASAAASTKTPLTDLLMAHMNRNEEGESYRRLDQEQQKVDEDEADQEYCNGADDEEMNEDDDGPTVHRNHEEGEEIEEEEKELFKEEFYTTMYHNFLEGKDDYDYASVDNNEEYDVGENLEQDEEEKYFDNEEPCEMNTDSNSTLDELFRPPIRCTDIENKISVLTVETIEPTTQNLDNNQNNLQVEEDEDELDVFMRSIEMQLNNQ